MPIYDATRETDAIARRLIAAVDFKRDDLNDVLAAMVTATTFALSLTCPECRKVIAKELRKHVPVMLREADELAAKDEPAEHRHMP